MRNNKKIEWTAEMDETMTQLFEAGVTLKEIAKEFNMSHITIGNHIRQDLGLLRSNPQDPLGTYAHQVGTWQFYTRSMMDFLGIRPNHGVYIA